MRSLFAPWFNKWVTPGMEIQLVTHLTLSWWRYGKSWRVGNASRNETNEILNVYLLKVWGFIPRRQIRVIWHSDQHYLVFGSGQGHWPGIFGRKCSNKQYSIFPKKRDNLFAGVATFLTEREEPNTGVFDTRLQSIKGWSLRKR